MAANPNKAAKLGKQFNSTKMKKLLGDNVLLQVENIYEKVDGKEVLKDFSREGKVLQSNVEDVKKGDKVYYLPFGGVQIDTMCTKKHRILCIPAEDVIMVI